MSDHFNSENQEKELLADEQKLPYLQEEKQDLPKDYDVTMKKLISRLDHTEATTTEGYTLFAVSLLICFILVFIQFMEIQNYPAWMEWLHPIVIFAEALIPFAVSFFLKNPLHATVLRFVGILVLSFYLFTLFWN
jgi:hypothetical protein